MSHKSGMNAPTEASAARRPAWPLVAGLLVLVILVSIAATLWVARTWLFPQPFRPVALEAREQAVLDAKLDLLAQPMTPARDPDTAAPAERRETSGPLRPEVYSERPEDRVIHFTQRELNAMIGRNPDLAERLVLHLSRDLLSATMLVTLPPDLPVFANQTVRIATGLRLRYEQGRPVVSIDGVSIMGVPLPAAWLGGIKGQDLVSLHGPGGGFWGTFAEGVRDLRIEEGRLRVELAE
jgi:hypothetical protein